MKRKLIIDTDPGVDDAMAISLAVKSKKLDILAITTVCGNSTVSNTTNNAQYILEQLGVSLPLFSGSKKPLTRKLWKAMVHGDTGLGGVTVPKRKLLPDTAVETIVSLARKYPGEITLLTLGPLTNIAKAIKKDPQAMSLFSEIIIMGGAITEPGNMNRVAEFNMFVDPEAADVVFSFPIKRTLVPLDVCNKVTLSLSDFAKLTNPTIKRFFINIAKPYIDNLRKEGFKEAIMYDPLTIYSFLYPSKVKKELFDIVVETKGEKTRGMTVADLRPNADKKNLTTVVMGCDSNIFKNDFIKILNS